MAIAAIALGSNLPGPLGSPTANLDAAVRRLRALGTVLAVSRWLATDPVGYLHQPPFLNGALLLETDLAPEPLLDALLLFERDGGRDRSHAIANGPRSIDLDLLLYDEDVIETDRLRVPHPEMHHRRFVLEPLAQIAPGMKHPVLGWTVEQMLGALSSGVS